jgi:hypothetical protein
MTHGQSHQMLLNSREQALYRQQLEKLESPVRRQYADPEFMRRWRQYVVSKELYAKAVREALDLEFPQEKELKGPRREVEPQTKKSSGPMDLNATDIFSPMTELNLHQLFTLRRF